MPRLRKKQGKSKRYFIVYSLIVHAVTLAFTCQKCLAFDLIVGLGGGAGETEVGEGETGARRVPEATGGIHSGGGRGAG